MFLLLSASIILNIGADPVGALPKGLGVGFYRDDPAKIEDHPYAVKLEYDNFGPSCTGSIVSAHYVVTTAYCVKPPPGFEYRFIIRAGSRLARHDGTVHNVDKIIIHDDWLHNDIALIRVKEPFKFDETRRAIPFYNRDDKIEIGTNATVTGWGEKPLGPSDRLHSLNVTTIKDVLCNNPALTCAENIKHEVATACRIDYGDPLVIGGRLAAILTLTSPFSCIGDEVSAYVKVTHYREWIDKHID